jgi:hypothetical protein
VTRRSPSATRRRSRSCTASPDRAVKTAEPLQAHSRFRLRGCPAITGPGSPPSRALSEAGSRRCRRGAGQSRHDRASSRTAASSPTATTVRRTADLVAAMSAVVAIATTPPAVGRTKSAVLLRRRNAASLSHETRVPTPPSVRSSRSSLALAPKSSVPILRSGVGTIAFHESDRADCSGADDAYGDDSIAPLFGTGGECSAARALVGLRETAGLPGRTISARRRRGRSRSSSCRVVEVEVEVEVEPSRRSRGSGRTCSTAAMSVLRVASAARGVLLARSVSVDDLIDAGLRRFGSEWLGAAGRAAPPAGSAEGATCRR